ncbi:MAG TPA: hypothetical protein VJX67_10065 [Blastocatellia bacterium]|nr:hypothetical protein [Blastocatellia bacterium]
MKSRSIKRPSRTLAPMAVIVVFVFLGLICLLVYSVLGVSEPSLFWKERVFWRDLLREAGVVLVTVFVVSMVYEYVIAEEHFSKFADELRAQIERGELNGALCERLGIVRLYEDRRDFERVYAFEDIARASSEGSCFWITGKSLFLSMLKPDAIREALSLGADVRLCSIDPEKVSAVLREAGLRKGDISAALERFVDLRDWINTTKPPGRLEIRFHRLDLFDSFFAFVMGGDQLGLWDVSFGADPREKRVMLVDRGKGLGRDLVGRYEGVWRSADPQFEYADRRIRKDNLPGAECPSGDATTSAQELRSEPFVSEHQE